MNHWNEYTDITLRGSLSTGINNFLTKPKETTPFNHTPTQYNPMHHLQKTKLLSRNFNHGDSNILNIISTRTITYDYNDEGARTKEINLARMRTRMLYSSFGLGYI